MYRFAFLLLALCPSLVEAAATSKETKREVVIDREWLAQRGQAPYVLDQSDTAYVLATDVHTVGTAFIIEASNVVFDLKQHKIVYGDGKPVVVPNGGFEEGSDRSVPGWDLSKAPAAELALNTSYLFGKQVLRLKSFRSAQCIVSDPIAVPETDHTYTATITPSGDDYRTIVMLTVLDAQTGKVLGKGRSPNVERGISAVAHFQPGASRKVRLQIEVTPPAGKTHNLDLDYATVAVSYDYGIVASNAWSGDIPGWNNLPATLRGSRKMMSDFTLKNGSVLQGGARGYGSSPLFFVHCPNLVVDGVQTFTGGLDTISLNAERASGSVVIRDSTLRHDVDNVTNRGAQCAAIRLAHVDGPVRVEGNRLLGVPLVGILLDEGRQTQIVRNEFQQRTVAVNGYAILVSATRDFEIAENRIVAENGRGILCDGYRKEPLENGNIHHNYVEAREHLYREYPTRLEVRALRLRGWEEGPHRNLNIHHNTFVAVCGPGLAPKAFAVRIGYTNKAGKLNHANLHIEHNTMRAITTSAEPSFRASALALDGLAAGVDLHIRENIFESNDVSVTLADTEGPAEDARLIANTFCKSTEGARRRYVAIHAGFWICPVRAIQVLDSRLKNGATLDVRWAGSGLKDLSIGRSFTMKVHREGKPVPDAVVSVRDKQGSELYSGKTDAKGELRDIPAIDIRYRQETADPNRITTDHPEPFSVNITSGGTTVSQKIALDTNPSVRIELAAADR